MRQGNKQLRDGAIPTGLLRFLDELPRRAARTGRFNSSPCICRLLGPFENQTVPTVVLRTIKRRDFALGTATT